MTVKEKRDARLETRQTELIRNAGGQAGVHRQQEKERECVLTNKEEKVCRWRSWLEK